MPTLVNVPLNTSASSYQSRQQITLFPPFILWFTRQEHFIASNDTNSSMSISNTKYFIPFLKRIFITITYKILEIYQVYLPKLWPLKLSSNITPTPQACAELPTTFLSISNFRSMSVRQAHHTEKLFYQIKKIIRKGKYCLKYCKSTVIFFLWDLNHSCSLLSST